MISGQMIRAALDAEKQRREFKPTQRNYQTFMPAKLGTEPTLGEDDTSRTTMERIGSWGETATATGQIQAQNASALDFLRQQQNMQDLLQNQLQNANQSQPNQVRPQHNPQVPSVNNLAIKGGMHGFQGIWAPLGRYNYQVTSPYGMRVNPVTGAHSFHTGVDLSAPEGTPIYAVGNGIIKKAGHNDIYGNQTILGLGHGRQVMFGHQSRIVVHAGERVRRGQLIGYVGSTGWATGPHLHYEMWRRMHPVNPSQYYRRF